MHLIVAVDDDWLDRNLEAVGTVYQCAFGATDDATLDFLDGGFSRHRTYPGFRFFAALNSQQALLGFVYGYRSAPGGWWRESIRPAIERAGQAWWLENAFEFVELAVSPAYQGRGIGGRLHDTILAGVTETSALLTTAMGPTIARRMYEARGWVPVVEDLAFQQGGETWAVLGLDVEAWQAARSQYAQCDT